MGPTPADSLFSIGATAVKPRVEPARAAVPVGAAGPEGRREGVERFSRSLQRATNNADSKPRNTQTRTANTPDDRAAAAQIEPRDAQETAPVAQEPSREGDRGPRDANRVEDVGERSEPAELEGAETGATNAPADETETVNTDAAPEAQRAVAQAAVTAETQAEPASPIEGVRSPVQGVTGEQAPQASEEAHAEILPTAHGDTRRPAVKPAILASSGAEHARDAHNTAGDATPTNETHEPGAPSAPSGSHVEEPIEESADASAQIRRLAAEAEAKAGRADDTRHETHTTRDPATANAILDRAEGRGALDRLIDAGRPADRAVETKPERAGDATKSVSQQTAAQAAPSQDGAPSNENKQQDQNGRRDARTHNARAIDSAHTAPKRTDDKPETHAPPKPGADPTLGAGAPSIKSGHDSVKPATNVHAAYDASNVEAAASRGLMAAVHQKGGTVTVRLDPESLGSMRIRMELTGGVVRATIEVTNPEARDLLGSKLDALRSSLEAKGLGVEKLQVQLTSAGHGSAANHDSSSGEGRGHGSRSSPDAGEGKTRGDTGGGRDGREHEPRDRKESGFAGALGGAWREDWVRVGVDALV